MADIKSTVRKRNQEKHRGIVYFPFKKNFFFLRRAVGDTFNEKPLRKDMKEREHGHGQWYPGREHHPDGRASLTDHVPVVVEADNMKRQRGETQ